MLRAGGRGTLFSAPSGSRRCYHVLNIGYVGVGKRHATSFFDETGANWRQLPRWDFQVCCDISFASSFALLDGFLYGQYDLAQGSEDLPPLKTMLTTLSRPAMTLAGAAMRKEGRGVLSARFSFDEPSLTSSERQLLLWRKPKKV